MCVLLYEKRERDKEEEDVLQLLVFYSFFNKVCTSFLGKVYLNWFFFVKLDREIFFIHIDCVCRV